VLITAAAGGVGSAAVQSAAAVGARVVAVASPSNHDYLRSLGASRDQALDTVRDGGRAISIVLQGTALQPERGITGESFAAHGSRPRLEQLAALVDAGKLRPQAETVLPLSQAREALARVAARHTRGKIALQIG
jgi:NADPH:quinone reductase